MRCRSCIICDHRQQKPAIGHGMGSYRLPILYLAVTLFSTLLCWETSLNTIHAHPRLTRHTRDPSPTQPRLDRGEMSSKAPAAACCLRWPTWLISKALPRQDYLQMTPLSSDYRSRSPKRKSPLDTEPANRSASFLRVSSFAWHSSPVLLYSLQLLQHQQRSSRQCPAISHIKQKRKHFKHNKLWIRFSLKCTVSAV